MIPGSRGRGIGARTLSRPPVSCPRAAGRRAENPLTLRAGCGRAGVFRSPRLTWAMAASKMVVGASARRPGDPEPRAAEAPSSVVPVGRFPGALTPARPEVLHGSRADTIPTHVHPRDLRPGGPRLGGGLLTTALQSPAPALVADALDRACLCARAAADNKARDVVVLDIGASPRSTTTWS